jgi:hypothetical protein
MLNLAPASGDIGLGTGGGFDSTAKDVEPLACEASLTVIACVPAPLAGGLKAMLKLPFTSVVPLVLVLAES